jgi:hypothetical protein
VPFVVRLDGTNDVEGRQILADAALPNVFVEETMLGAAARVVELAGQSPANGQERPEADPSSQSAGLDAPRR